MIEFIIYILLGSICGAGVRIYHAIHNGLFYNVVRAESNIHPKLLKYFKNIHALSSPMNYLQQLMAFFYVFAAIRIMNPEFSWIIILEIIAAGLIALGQSTVASYHWQIWINRGSGLPDIDPNESEKTEIVLFGYSFWISTGKLFNGKNSVYLPLIGLLYITIAIFIIFFFIT